MTYTLVLLRHGESEWNAKNLFTGWVDVPLTDKGRAEATRGGELIAEADVLPDVLHTSVLRRAITTAHLALDACDRHWIPVRRSWRLNERHYGALQGKDKKADARGVRRGAVHALAALLRHPAAADRRRRRVVPGRRRRATPTSPTRSCRAPSASRTWSQRMLPYWYDAIVPDLRSGQDRLRRRARQLPAGAGQAPRRHVRGGRRRAQHPHRHPAGLPARRAPAADVSRAASTSTRTPPPTRSRPSRTRAAEPQAVSRRRRNARTRAWSPDRLQLLVVDAAAATARR